MLEPLKKISVTRILQASSLIYILFSSIIKLKKYIFLEHHVEYR